MSSSRPKMCREGVLETMKSASLEPPDLDHLFEHWPRATSPHYRILREEADAFLTWVVPPGRKRESYLASDFAWLFASWFPYAPLEALKILTCANIWLFLWDDEIDAATGSLWDAWDAAEAFRQVTKDFVRACLGLARDTGDPYALADDIRIYSGGKALGRLAKIYGNVEQRVRLSDSIQTIEQFCSVRPASSGASQEMCYLPLACGYPVLELPGKVLNDAAFQTCWSRCEEIVAYVNDVWSVRREIDDNAIDSLVPLFYAQQGDLDKAWLLTVDMIATKVKEFDDAAESLLRRFASAPESPKLTDFVKGCRYICTGNLMWR
ncbi:Terpenoid synthase [Metarhizium album ARSEF 1941]|uniref:Terpenoid synthase n=1 Tax=Metarhizium album (strain ARSEF 1941) TaxID=1081103 RepID=A0A0B2WN72_METAS|nr:Terpenoid synthase [Metarhizium album ARSEF 1941]KHN95383.1 Terpenoid synthase [Metarhizium album ARSEF 1941]